MLAGVWLLYANRPLLFLKPFEEIESLVFFESGEAVCVLNKADLEDAGIMDVLKSYGKGSKKQALAEHMFSHDVRYRFVVTYLSGEEDAFEYTENPSMLYRYTKPKYQSAITAEDEERILLNLLKGICGAKEEQ